MGTRVHHTTLGLQEKILVLPTQLLIFSTGIAREKGSHIHLQLPIKWREKLCCHGTTNRLHTASTQDKFQSGGIGRENHPSLLGSRVKVEEDPCMLVLLR